MIKTKVIDALKGLQRMSKYTMPQSPTTRPYRATFHKDTSGWYFQITANNGNVMAYSMYFQRRYDCKQSLAHLIEKAHQIEVEEC